MDNSTDFLSSISIIFVFISEFSSLGLIIDDSNLLNIYLFIIHVFPTPDSPNKMILYL